MRLIELFGGTVAGLALAATPALSADDETTDKSELYGVR
jgi:hypothetical protein